MAPQKSKSTKPAAKPSKPSNPNRASSGNSRKGPSKNSSSEIPYTSFASRKRRQPTCSMASLRDLETEEDIEENFKGLFGEQSESHYTWGRTESKPIVAIKRKGPKAPRLGKMAMGKMPGPPGLFAQFEGTPEPAMPNSPDRSPLLRLPLEVREKIYTHFLIYRRPIIVHLIG